MTTPFVGIAEAEFQAGGYYKNFSTVFNSPLPDTPIAGIVVNRLRLNLSYAPADALSFAFAYDFTPRVQDPLLFSQSPFAVGVSLRPVTASQILTHSSIRVRMNPSAASVSIIISIVPAVQFSTDFADFSIGRDAIAWGSARIVNPTDVIAPYTYDQLDTEDRVGVDAIRVRIPIGVMGEVDTGYIFGNKFNFDKSAVFLRTQLNAVETDFSILLLEFQRDLLFGLDITRGIGGAGFWLETAYVFTQPSDNDTDASKNYPPILCWFRLQFRRRDVRLYRISLQRSGCEEPPKLPHQLREVGVYPRWCLSTG